MKKKIKRRRTGKGDGPSIGAELIEALKEVHAAITTGDYSGMIVRQVELPDAANRDRRRKRK